MRCSMSAVMVPEAPTETEDQASDLATARASALVIDVVPSKWTVADLMVWIRHQNRKQCPIKHQHQWSLC